MHQDRTGPLHGSSDTLSEDELLLELEVLPAVNRPSEDMLRPLRRHGSMSYESDRFENCIAERCREQISPALPYPPVQR